MIQNNLKALNYMLEECSYNPGSVIYIIMQRNITQYSVTASYEGVCRICAQLVHLQELLLG